MGVGIKIGDRQGLHFVKQVIPQTQHGSLADIDHDPVVGKRGDDADPHHTGQLDQIRAQAAEIVRPLGKHWHDVIVHQFLGKTGPNHRGHRVDQDTGHHDQKRIFIIVEHILDHPLNGGCNSRYSCSGMFVTHSIFLLSLLSRLVEVAAAFQL